MSGGDPTGGGTKGEKMDKNYRPPFDVPETARRLRASEQVIRRLLLRGELKGFKVGREWRITAESLDKLAGEAAEV
jgi:excisionase family DNA binding protein